MFLPSSLLLISLASCVSGQDGSTWWIYPNSTEPFTLSVGERVTLKWTTDYPTFFIVLYQNLGDGYAEFNSTYILKDGSHDTTSLEWLVQPFGSLTASNNDFHFNLAHSSAKGDGANSQDFKMIPSNENSLVPTGTSTPSYTYGSVLPTSTGLDSYYTTIPTTATEPSNMTRTVTSSSALSTLPTSSSVQAPTTKSSTARLTKPTTSSGTARLTENASATLFSSSSVSTSKAAARSSSASLSGNATPFNAAAGNPGGGSSTLSYVAFLGVILIMF